MDPLFAAEIAKEALADLRGRIARLARALRGLPTGPAVVCIHEHGAVPSIRRGRDAHAAAATAVAQIEFHDEQDERRVVRFVGAVAVDSGTLLLARELNRSKADFAASIKQYRRLVSRRERDSHHVRELLIRFGEARMNLVQAYRQIPVLDAVPDRIGFSWILGSTQVSPVSRDDADPGSASPRSAPPPQVDRVAPHMRANLVWTVNGGRRAACVHAPLPILYPYDSQHEPRITGVDRPEPDAATRPPRRRRRDAGQPRHRHAKSDGRDIAD